MDFVDFNLAKKLKEKGFTCEYPIAMYNERGIFHELYTSVGNMQYYDYDDFDEHDYIAPTISQVLKWLREEKNIYIEIFLYNGKYSPFIKSITQICKDDYFHKCLNEDAADEEYDTYNQAALAGIEYVLDYLS